MSRRKSFGLAIFIAIGVFGEETRSAYADCNGFCATEWSGGSVINLGGLPGFESSEATSINGAGQVVGDSGLSGLRLHATEWSGGSIINLGPGVATSINDAGQVAGYGIVGGVDLPRIGAAAALSPWEDCQTPTVASLTVSIAWVRRWDRASLAAPMSLPSGAAAASLI